MTPVFRLQNFSFSYASSEKKIFSRNPIMDIEQGDVVWITGRSGCGKSSLLYALKGLLGTEIAGTTTGQIFFQQHPINQKSFCQRIGLLLQNINQMAICRTVYEELAFGLENLCLDPTQIHKIIKQKAASLDITHLLPCLIKDCSYGQKQKIFLLSLLLTGPDVLLLDEPTAFLDPPTAHLCAQLIQSQISGKTVVIVEHNPHYIKSFITKTWTMEDSGCFFLQP